MPTYSNFFASTKDRIHVVVGRCTTPNRSPAHVGFVPKIKCLPCKHWWNSISIRNRWVTWL